MEPDFVSEQYSDTVFTEKFSERLSLIRSASVALIRAAFPITELITAMPAVTKLSFRSRNAINSHQRRELRKELPLIVVLLIYTKGEKGNDADLDKRGYSGDVTLSE